MKNYIIPKTTVETLLVNAFVCGVGSLNLGEQQGEQLVPDRRPMAN